MKSKALVTDLNQTTCRVIANLIIVRSVEDYEEALEALSKDPNDDAALMAIYEIEAFFRSDWAELLSDLDYKTVLERVRKMYPTVILPPVRARVI